MRIAETKPFGTFAEFYPFYLSQHADVTCRRLHFIGTSLVLCLVFTRPDLFALPALAATVLGYLSFVLTRHLSHGFVEFAMMMGGFLLGAALCSKWMSGGDKTNSARKRKELLYVALVPVVGYGFAWVGHFYFEKNRPATFIYPLFSLWGDFRLWFEIASTQRAF